MPISSGANGWPIRHFRKAPPAPEPKLKRFINVMPHDTYYPSPKPAPTRIITPTKYPPPTPSPPLSPEPKRKRYTPSPEPNREPGCCGGDGDGGACGGGCGKGCCARLCGGSACCWSDDDYRNFGQRGYGRWWARGGGKRARGCCASRCCRCWLALLLGLLFLLLLLAIILALVFGLQAYTRTSTTTTLTGKNVYYSVLGKYQNCSDPAGTTPKNNQLPLCNTTTTTLVPTPLGFTTPYADPTTAGGNFPTGGATIVAAILVLMLMGIF